MFNSDDNVDYDIIIEKLIKLSNDPIDIYKCCRDREITNNLIELINKHRILNNRNQIKNYNIK